MLQLREHRQNYTSSRAGGGFNDPKSKLSDLCFGESFAEFTTDEVVMEIKAINKPFEEITPEDLCIEGKCTAVFAVLVMADSEVGFRTACSTNLCVSTIEEAQDTFAALSKWVDDIRSAGTITAFALCIHDKADDSLIAAEYDNFVNKAAGVFGVEAGKLQ